jgi:hypothetical protein
MLKLLKLNSRSDVILASLNDVSQAYYLPRVIHIYDFHIIEMLNQLDTCRCLIVPHVIADVGCHLSLMTWSVMTYFLDLVAQIFP